MDSNGLENTAAFIRENRSNEGNFNKLYNRLDTEIKNGLGSEKYVANLQEIKEKWADEYKKAKDTAGTAWPEFEKFVTEFERAVLDAK